MTDNWNFCVLQRIVFILFIQKMTNIHSIRIKINKSFNRFKYVLIKGKFYNFFKEILTHVNNYFRSTIE